MLLFGIAFGIGDQTSPMQDINMGRIPLRESMILHNTPGVLDNLQAQDRQERRPE
ncbi:hypothetical protein AB0937_13165 [Streptomyces sp. NPDC047880]|uniref:hypothetical protein n=1 Tax=Streptomyces sp. NPDC047880 TaxID=3155626 RepID=UPI0034538858